MKLGRFAASAAAVVTLTSAASAQWSENFDSYAPGVLVPQGGWVGWDNAPAAAQSPVVTTQSLSGPNSVQVSGPDDLVHEYDGYTSGVWAFTVHQFVPTDFAGQSYHLLLNTYAAGGPYNWSLQVIADSTSNTIEDVDSGDSLPLIKGQWCEISSVIDLGQDTCSTYYNGTLLSSKSWTDGASGNGALDIGCVDLFGNGASAVFYDDLSITEVPPIGACCFSSNGSCTENMTIPDCNTAGGLFQGFGTTCAAVTCYVYGSQGWEVTAPISWPGDTCFELSNCVLRPSGDERWKVTIPWEADWTFSICGTATFDSMIFLSTNPCSNNLGTDDDGCGDVTSTLTRHLMPGTYYLILEGFSSTDCGEFVMNMTSGPCAITLPGGATPEGETTGCGTPGGGINSGCNVTPPQFSSISCGETVSGTGWSIPGVARDTDWYQIVLTEDTEVTWGGEAEYESAVYGIVDTGGSGNCADATALNPFALMGNPCIDGVTSFTTVLPPGIYWFFHAPLTGTDVPCDSVYNHYYATLTCKAVALPCPADLDGNGDVGFGDVLMVLNAWGQNGVPEDLDGGGVGFSDVLFILNAWGPCP